MRLAMLLATLLFAVPGSAPAQEIRFDIQPTLDCIDNATRSDQRPICVGEGARACIRRLPSSTMLGVSMCLGEETSYWMVRMNAALESLQTAAEASDAAFGETALSQKVPFLMTEDLAAMQTAWEKWREERCTFAAMLYRGTPNAGSSAASCMMTLTGAQALYLERSLAALTE